MAWEKLMEKIQPYGHQRWWFRVWVKLSSLQSYLPSYKCPFANELDNTHAQGTDYGRQFSLQQKLLWYLRSPSWLLPTGTVDFIQLRPILTTLLPRSVKLSRYVLLIRKLTFIGIKICYYLLCLIRKILITLIVRFLKTFQ